MKPFKTLILALATLLLPFCSFALPSGARMIDMPTAEAAPQGSFDISARMFSAGGMLLYLDYGVTNIFTIGASATAEHLIGSDDQTIKLLTPALQLKLRLYDGGGEWPAVAIGFDNQGFLYNHATKEYSQKARGAYLALTKEVFTPGLLLTAGPNMTVEDFEFDKLAGFTGVSYNIRDLVSLMFEWDNIRTLKESRLSAGLRLHLHQNFALDFAFRDFNHTAERVAQLHYTFAI